jgi:glutamine synthetase
MDELLARCYLAVRRSEDEEFSVQDQEFEIRHHFYRF